MTSPMRDGEKLAERLLAVKEYTNELLYEAAKAEKLVQATRSPFIIVSVESRDLIVAALRTSPPPPDAGVREALEKLIRTTQLLQQNSEGCAVNHHGLDFEQQGLPGWLRDTQASIDFARAAFARAPVAGEAVDPIKRIDERLADLRGANSAHWKSSRDMTGATQRNDREIRWLIDLRTILLSASALTAQAGGEQGAMAKLAYSDAGKIAACRCGEFPRLHDDGAKPDDGYRSLWCQTCMEHVTTMMPSEREVIDYWNDLREKEHAVFYAAPQAPKAAEGKRSFPAGNDRELFLMTHIAGLNERIQRAEGERGFDPAQGSGDCGEVVWLKEVDAGTDNACWIISNRVDPEAVPFFSGIGYSISSTPGGCAA